MTYAIRRKLKKNFGEEKVKKGRRTYGAIYTRPDGSRFYLAWRRKGGLFRDGELTDSAAFREKKAMWALDFETITMLRLKGIEHVGILDHTSGDIWITRLWYYLNKCCAPPRNYTARGGSDQRFLPTYYFKRRLGPVKIK
ncbi:hypothetical protein [Phyllobacterium myrsinacearum]|uniref:Uncharacterized protein n=1 Tax=Phyllobacterium myrsinacearum TaxID=28101 RepID=A0A839ESL1_9HYPH|nr:hypothetical protein [Phyllobacterium myrsinacearum]MBA8881782.1 hypothetical protein [Phyllobacterium myrsinacearum]